MLALGDETHKLSDFGVIDTVGSGRPIMREVSVAATHMNPITVMLCENTSFPRAATECMVECESDLLSEID